MIHLHQVGHAYGPKICITPLNKTIYSGQKIAIIGQNGCGKSTLLNIICQKCEPSEGSVLAQDGTVLAYVGQTILDFAKLSGGQRFNKALSQALALQPNVLCLDEPTNHLDQKNRQSLLRMLERFQGTLIMVTHDLTLLNRCVDQIWHIEAGVVHTFSGSYDDYKNTWLKKREKLQLCLSDLERERKQAHLDLMREQRRAKNKKEYGKKKYGRDGCGLKAVANQKEHAAALTAGKNKKIISNQKQEISEKLQQLRLPEIIRPSFGLSTASLVNKTVVNITHGKCGYGDKIVLSEINFQLKGKMRLAIKGENGSGKSTLVKAILNEFGVRREGIWQVPKREIIGYLDQHYATLNPNSSALELVQEVMPTWKTLEVRQHLNHFLFKNNEEVTAKVQTLSGGEKCRLSLACIAAINPKLLILDEVTNNLDLETKEHVVQVLNAYSGAMIVISHDEDFLGKIGVEENYAIVSYKRGTDFSSMGT